jgi:hypothetical protein
VGTNDDGRAIYCCGYQSANQTTDECANGDAPFILEDGEMVFRRAALADATEDGNSSSWTTASTSPTATGTDAGTDSATCSNNDVAIGAGVGVPLGVLALSAVAWALLERRRRVKTVAGVGMVEHEHGRVREVFIPPQRKTRPTELDQETASSSPDTLIHGREVVELMGSERETISR